MIRIDRLELRLPQGMESRASSIAHEVGSVLSAWRVSRSATVDKLRIPPIRVGVGATNGEIARAVAKQIVVRAGGER